MDTTTTPTGEWAPQYAERLHHLDGIVPPIDWTNRPPGLDAWDAPFGEPEPREAATSERQVPGPHGPVPVRIYRPASGETSGLDWSGSMAAPSSPAIWTCPRPTGSPTAWWPAPVGW